ncbi:MAG: hypothetical protein MHM6MM_004142 [Cercozoa sp. M6MM]
MNYIGEDVNALVLDIGTQWTRAGFTGDVEPKAKVYSALGVDLDDDQPSQRHLAGDELHVPHKDLRVLSPVQHGLVDDWDAVQRVWRHAFDGVLNLKMREHPVMLVEPNHNTRDRREKACELLFEGEGVPAVFLAKAATLASFSVGRPTALVVEAGAGVLSTTPVQDGYVLMSGHRHTRMAGNFLDERMEQLMLQDIQGNEIIPDYEAHGDVVSGITSSYRRFWQNDVIRDAKEALCQVSLTPLSQGQPGDLKTAKYELPDGQTLSWAQKRTQVPELFFTGADIENDLEADFEFTGIGGMMNESIRAVDVDVQRDLYSSVVLAGGCTDLDNFAERLSSELLRIAPGSAKIKVVAPSAGLPACNAAWIGGSILSSLGTFQQLWFSKQEYEEHGAQYIKRKCP